MPCEAEVAYRRGTMLSVPIMWTLPTRRHGAARRRQPVRSLLRSAVQRGRPEAHRGDRDADRHRDSEHAARARIAQPAAAHPGARARARSADEAPPARRRRRAGGAGGGARRARRERRRRLLQSLPPLARSHGHHDRRRVEPRLSRRAHHGARDERVGDSRAGVAGSRCGARVARGNAARGARDDGDVHHRVLRRDRSRREDAALREHGTSARVSRWRERSGRAPSRDRSADRHGRVAARTRGRARGRPAATCCCSSPTA